jgi:hypothetical protein
MKNRKGATLDIYDNLAELEEPLFLAGDLLDFFSGRFREEMSHDDSEETRERLLKARIELVNNLDELFRVLSAIDPDLVLEWQICNCNDEDDDEE